MKTEKWKLILLPLTKWWFIDNFVGWPSYIIQGYGTFDSYEGCRGLYPATSRLQSVTRMNNIQHIIFHVPLQHHHCSNAHCKGASPVLRHHRRRHRRPLGVWLDLGQEQGTEHGLFSNLLKDNHGLFSSLLKDSHGTFSNILKDIHDPSSFQIRQTRLAEERAWPQPMYGDLVTNK